jgi:hypothetical protein
MPDFNMRGLVIILRNALFISVFKGAQNGLYEQKFACLSNFKKCPDRESSTFRRF